jgi:anaerobic magnesium-protoporphyrin IX monomethyl ester cyclase
MPPTVLLINPTYKQPGVLDEYFPKSLPLSLGFLIGVLLENNIEVILIDEQFEKMTVDKVERLVRQHNIRVIGFTVLTTVAFHVYDQCLALRKTLPDLRIVLGGVHPTLLPEEGLKNNAADYVVRSEGEITFLELVKAIYDDKEQEKIHIEGISYNDNGNIIHNPARELIPDLNDLPYFPYSFFDSRKEEYDYKIIFTSRGCPYNCIFCSQRPVSGKKYRNMSPENVIKIIDLLVDKYQQKFILFNEDNFIVNKNHASEICKHIIDKNYPPEINFGCQTRGDALDEEILLLMKKANFSWISLGMETGSERLMKMIKKGETVETNLRAVELCRKVGIPSIHGAFIIGLPTETREETKLTLRTAQKSALTMATFNILVPYPGTEVYEIAKREGNIISTDWSNMTTKSGFVNALIPYVPKNRTNSELKKLQIKGYLLYYLSNPVRLKHFFKYVLKMPNIFSLKGLKAYLKIALWILKLSVTKIIPTKK